MNGGTTSPAMQMAARTKVPEKSRRREAERGRETNVGTKGNFRELEQHNQEPQISSRRNQEIEHSIVVPNELFVYWDRVATAREYSREDKVRSDRDR
jgi:hypothetical protein